MVFYVQVDIAVVESEIAAFLAGHKQRRRLTPSGITTRRLSRRQGVDQSRREVARSCLEGCRNGIDDLWTGEQVALRSVVFSGSTTGP